MKSYHFSRIIKCKAHIFSSAGQSQQSLLCWPCLHLLSSLLDPFLSPFSYFLLLFPPLTKDKLNPRSSKSSPSSLCSSCPLSKKVPSLQFCVNHQSSQLSCLPSGVADILPWLPPRHNNNGGRWEKNLRIPQIPSNWLAEFVSLS